MQAQCTYCTTGRMRYLLRTCYTVITLNDNNLSHAWRGGTIIRQPWTVAIKPDLYWVKQSKFSFLFKKNHYILSQFTVADCLLYHIGHTRLCLVLNYVVCTVKWIDTQFIEKVMFVCNNNALSLWISFDLVPMNIFCSCP